MAVRIAALAALLASGVAQAQSGADWSLLSPQQRSVLAPLEREWTSITPAQRQKWVEVAGRYATQPPAEQARIQQRMAEWSRLGPQERARARLNFQEARQLGPEERQRQWEAYRALPVDQRRELAERAQPANGGKRDAQQEHKSNVVRVPATTAPRPVGPTVVQRGSGATTNLVSKPAAPPLHQQAGLPKVAAMPGFVDAATLLPQRGAQAAAVRSDGDDKRGRKTQDK